MRHLDRIGQRTAILIVFWLIVFGIANLFGWL